MNGLTAKVLAQRLDAPLPGARAHRVMLPPGRPLPDASRARADARRGAVLAALIPGSAGRLEFPMIQRTDDGGPHALQVSLPGGAAEPTDADLAATAVREAEEEIALPAGYVHVLGTLSPLYVEVSNFLITPVVAWIEPDEFAGGTWGRLRPQPNEVLRLVRGSVARMPKTLATRRLVVRGFSLEAPSFLASDGDIVWGATGMILAELFRVLGTL
jgi:8-oxo-dGTP pyrophosphatase MutT (NUDIX family)